MLVPEAAIMDRLGQLAADIDRDYAGRQVLLIGVLKGAILMMADLARRLEVSAALAFLVTDARPDLAVTLAHVRHGPGLRDDHDDLEVVRQHATWLGIPLLTCTADRRGRRCLVARIATQRQHQVSPTRGQ